MINDDFEDKGLLMIGFIINSFTKSEIELQKAAALSRLEEEGIYNV